MPNKPDKMNVSMINRPSSSGHSGHKIKQEPHAIKKQALPITARLTKKPSVLILLSFSLALTACQSVPTINHKAEPKSGTTIIINQPTPDSPTIIYVEEGKVTTLSKDDSSVIAVKPQPDAKTDDVNTTLPSVDSTTTIETKPVLSPDTGNNNVSVPEETPTSESPAPPKDTRTIQEILLERARSNSQSNTTTSAPVLNNGDNVPAFKRLMAAGVSQLKNGQYSAADSTFTRAQRLAPQSSAVYFYLGQVAIKRNQPRRAEAMARRGLVVAQSRSRRKGLWQVILLAGKMQDNQKVIDEAQAALSN